MTPAGPGRRRDDEPPVVVPIEDALDLHSFAPREIRALVDGYLEECVRRGFREVRLIHGRGTGTQRAAIRSLLSTHPLVLEFGDAPPDRGGWGATVVVLREGPAGS
jgi:DNA-nicking Smr family endonuclease